MVQSSFWQKYDRQIPYLNKAELAESGEVFYVQGITSTEGGKYGPQWVLTVQRDDDSTAKIGFQRNPNRDDKMMVLVEELEGGYNSIPARIVRFTTKAGDQGFDLAPPED